MTVKDFIDNNKDYNPKKDTGYDALVILSKKFNIDYLKCNIEIINPNDIKYIFPYNFDKINGGYNRLMGENVDYINWDLNKGWKVNINNLMFCKGKVLDEKKFDFHDMYTKKNYKKLYLDIKKNGYVYNKSLPTIVCLDRDGNICFIDGQHRFIISKLLKIEKYPVIILFKHPYYEK